jgi:hypothetical protein
LILIVSIFDLGFIDKIYNVAMIILNAGYDLNSIALVDFEYSFLLLSAYPF